MDWALFDTRSLAKAIEEVVGKDKIEQIKEELAFASLHRSFHEGKRILIFDRPFENDVTALKSQFAAGQTYKQNLWDRVLNHPTFSDAKYKDILKITLESLQGAMFTDDIINKLLVIISSPGGVTHGIHTLDNHFEKTIIEDLKKFYASHPKMDRARVTETSRDAENQGKILANALKNSTLISTYSLSNNRELFTFLTDLKTVSQGESQAQQHKDKNFDVAFYRTEHWHYNFLDYITKSVAESKGLTPLGMETFNHALKGLIFVHFGKYLEKFSYESSKAFFTELSQDALDVIRGKSNKLHYGIEATSNHMKGLAVDFGSSNPQDLKKELVEFFRKEGYYILIYHYSGGPIKYRIKQEKIIQPQIDSIPWNELPPTWFFHVDRSR